MALENEILKQSENRNTDKINELAKSISHLKIITNLKEKLSKKQRQSVFLAEKQQEEGKNNYFLITSKMIRTVFVIN